MFISSASLQLLGNILVPIERLIMSVMGAISNIRAHRLVKKS